MNKVIEADFFPRNSDELSPPFSIGVSGVTGKRRILIVDEDYDVTHLVKVLLERTGHYLVLEENARRGPNERPLFVGPDLILLDVVMPETDGGEVAARIQADSELQNTPIIFLTALVTRAEAKSGLNIQGHPFLAKPVSIPELINAIERRLPVRTTSHVLSRRRDHGTPLT